VPLRGTGILVAVLFCNELSGQLVKNRLSDNVGGVKQQLRSHYEAVKHAHRYDWLRTRLPRRLVLLDNNVVETKRSPAPNANTLVQE
jgi:hypothetical protein